MTTIFKTTWAVCCSGLLIAGLSRAQEDSTQRAAEAEKLVGTYEVFSGERNGEKIAADRLKGITIKIAANAITTYDKDEKEVYAATYKLDTSKKPWQIMMTATITPVDDDPSRGGKGTKAAGLIGVRGDSVMLIYALPGGKAPTEFKTADQQQMFVLKRME